jgi:predicted dehydrogenase
MAALRVGVIGVGSLGFHHARILSGMPDVRFSGVYDTDRRARLAEVAAARRTAHAERWLAAGGL